MATKKFRPQDIVLNTMKTHPRCEFFIFDSKVYYNSKPEQSGAFSANVVTKPGHLSLYEYNIDRQASGSSTNGKAHAFNEFIRPFITKDSAGSSFRSVTSSGGLNEWTTASVGDVLYGQYPMTASISRKYLDVAGHKMAVYNSETEDTQKIDYYYSPGAPESDKFTDPRIGESARLIPQYPHYWALKNRLDFYGSQSPHFRVTGNLDAHEDSYEWIKDYQTINLISIPSIFFGSKIKPGSLSLKWYYTGSLAGELRDIKRNGELIQVSGGVHASSHNDKVAGVVMYDEGFILLTGSWELMPDHEIPMTNPSSSDSPKWIYFGAGTEDGVNTSTAGANFISCSFNLSFEGTNETQVMTMFTHAKRGEVNYSNNPTFLLYGQDNLKITSSNIYEENPDRLLANVASSSFTGHSASFERQVFISRVAIYDESKNLIGVATLANPVLKKEDQDYTFKLKLDI